MGAGKILVGTLLGKAGTVGEPVFEGSATERVVSAASGFVCVIGRDEELDAVGRARSDVTVKNEYCEGIWKERVEVEAGSVTVCNEVNVEVRLGKIPDMEGIPGADVVVALEVVTVINDCERESVAVLIMLLVV